jgi:hypothetical protein
MVIIQSLPFNRLASRIFAAAPKSSGVASAFGLGSGGGREEGGILGGIFNGDD